MRYIFILLLLSGCSAHAEDKTNIPTGEQVFSALFKHGAINLRNEPLCKANMDLFSQISLSLSVSYESENVTTIKSTCSPSKHELSNNKIIDVWDCSIYINENNKKGEFISSSTIVFSLTQDKKEFVEGSLRCR